MDKSTSSVQLIAMYLTFKTTAPNVRVTNLRVVNETETSMELVWTPVGCVERSNLPIRVRIVVRELPSGNIIGIGNVPDQGKYTRTDLEAGSFYSFQVLAAGQNETFGTDGPVITGITLAPGNIIFSI